MRGRLLLTVKLQYFCACNEMAKTIKRIVQEGLVQLRNQVSDNTVGQCLCFSYYS